MSAFKLSLLTLAATAVSTAASLGPASAQPRVILMVYTQSAGGSEEVGYRERYRYGYRPLSAVWILPTDLTMAIR